MIINTTIFIVICILLIYISFLFAEWHYFNYIYDIKENKSENEYPLINDKRYQKMKKESLNDKIIDNPASSEYQHHIDYDNDDLVNESYQILDPSCDDYEDIL